MNLVDKVSTLETTMLQLIENNAELAKLVKALYIVNDKVQEEKCVIIEQLACLKGEMKSSNKINALFDKMDTLSSEVASIHRSHIEIAPCVEAISREVPRNQSRNIFVVDEQIRHDIPKVTTDDNKPVEVHRVPNNTTPSDVLKAVRSINICKETDGLIISCSCQEDTCGGAIEEVKEFTDLLNGSVEVANTLTVGSVLPDIKGSNNERIQEINCVLKNKCLEIGATFVENDRNFRFQDGSCDTSSFKGSGNHLSKCGVNKLLNNLSLMPYTENRNNNRPQHKSYAYVAGKAIRVDGSKHIHKSKRETHNRSTSRNSDAGRVWHTVGQCKKCGETNHVTKKCRHDDAVTCFTCGKKGHKSHHHAKD